MGVKRALIAVELFIFAALITLSAALLIPLQNTMFTGITALRDSFLERVKSQTGANIVYERLSPSLFGTLDLRNITISRTDEERQPVPFISIERLRLRYSLWDIISGRGIHAVSSIRVDAPVITLDGSVFSRSGAQSGGGGAHTALINKMQELVGALPENFHVRIVNGRLNVEYQNQRVAVQSFSLAAETAAGGLDVKADWIAEAELAGANGAAIAVSVPGSAAGSFSTEARRGDFTLTLPELRTNFFSLRQTSFLAVWTEESFVLRKIDDSRPFDLSFFARYDGPVYYARFQAARFSPKEILRFHGALEQYNTYLSCEFEGSASVEKKRDENISYSLNLTGNMRKAMIGEEGFFEVNAAGTAEEITVRKLALSLERGAAAWSGTLRFEPLTPNGTLSFNRFYIKPNTASSAGAPLSGVIQISGGPRVIHAYAKELDIGGTVLSAVALDARRSNRAWDIGLSALRFDNVESYNNVGVARLNAQGLWTLRTNNLDLDVRLEAFNAADILNVAALAVDVPRNNSAINNIAHGTALTAGITLSTNFKNLSYDIPNLVVAYQGLKPVIAVARASGTEKRMEIPECHIAYGSGIDIRASAEYANPKNFFFSLATTIDNVNYETQGRMSNGRDITLSSNYGLSAAASLAQDGGARGRVDVQSMAIPMLERPQYISMDVDFNYRSFNNWLVSVKTLDIRGADAGSNTLAHISGIINQDNAAFSELVFAGADSLLSGDAFVMFSEKQNSAEDAPLAPSLRVSLTSQDGKEHFFAEGRRHDSSFDVSLDALNVKLYRFFTGAVPMELTGKFDIGFESPREFYMAFDIASLSGRSNAQPFNVSAKGSLSDEKLDMGESSIKYADMVFTIPYVSMNRGQGTLDTTVYAASKDKDGFSAELSLKAGYAKTNSWGAFAAAAQDINGAVSIVSASFIDAHDKRPYEFLFEKQKDIIKISGGPDRMLAAEVDTKGEFYANISSPSPVQGTITGSLHDNIISVHAADMLFDLAGLQHIIPRDFPIIPTGGVAVADITIQGSSTDPQFYGAVQGYGARVVLPQYIAAEIGPAPVNARLTGDSIIFDPIVTPAGGGAASVQCALHFDRWIPRNFEVSVTVPEESPVPFAIDIKPIKSEGRVSGNIALAMLDSTLDIKGNLYGSDSIISLSSALAEYEQKNNNDVVVQTDINITAGKRVEFLWPYEYIPILRTNIDRGAAIVIKSNTLNEHFSIAGDIELRGGELYYFQRSFYIKEGHLAFNESEESFEPRLTAMAESRDQNADGPVRLSIIVDDQPLTSFTPRIVSEPALTQVEILSMLGNTLVGVPDAETNKISARTVIAAATDAFAQFQIYRRFEQTLRDLLHVDMFSARTQTLQNIVIQALAPENDPENTTISNNRVGAYFDNTTVLVGKYIGKGSDMFVQAMVATRYDKNKIELGGVSFEVDIGIELTNPLFSVRWDVRPQHEKTLWIEDTSITIQRTWHLP